MLCLDHTSSFLLVVGVVTDTIVLLQDTTIQEVFARRMLENDERDAERNFFDDVEVCSLDAQSPPPLMLIGY